MNVTNGKDHGGRENEPAIRTDSAEPYRASISSCRSTSASIFGQWFPFMEYFNVMEWRRPRSEWKPKNMNLDARALRADNVGNRYIDRFRFWATMLFVDRRPSRTPSHTDTSDICPADLATTASRQVAEALLLLDQLAGALDMAAIGIFRRAAGKSLLGELVSKKDPRFGFSVPEITLPGKEEPPDLESVLRVGLSDLPEVFQQGIAALTVLSKTVDECDSGQPYDSFFVEAVGVGTNDKVDRAADSND